MSRTSAKAKNAYNARNYDRINLSIPKGLKEEWQASAQRVGQSLNAYILEAVEARRAGDGNGIPEREILQNGNSRFPSPVSDPSESEASKE